MRVKRQLPFKSKTKYAIVLEGECEHWYIQMLKRNERQLGFDLKPEIPQKKKISDQYEQVKELAKTYDKVFWMIDCDVVAAESRLTAKGTESPADLLKKHIAEVEAKYSDRIVVIRNNPCLEYWLLLHFEETAAPFHSCEAAGKRLKGHLPTYEKSRNFFTKQDKDIYLQLKGNLEEAVKRATKIEKTAKADLTATISQMHLLFHEVGLIEKAVTKK